MFVLNPRLEQDSHLIEVLPLPQGHHCQLRLINDSRFPWLIAVPEIEAATDIYSLDAPIRTALHTLSDDLASSISAHYEADKMNVAVIGNVVLQLHIHVVARFKSDAVWPAPVWGNGTPQPYTDTRLEQTLTVLRRLIPTVSLE
ncbi:MAG: HIT family protein [bacterium]